MLICKSIPIRDVLLIFCVYSKMTEGRTRQRWQSNPNYVNFLSKLKKKERKKVQQSRRAGVTARPLAATLIFIFKNKFIFSFLFIPKIFKKKTHTNNIAPIFKIILVCQIINMSTCKMELNLYCDQTIKLDKLQSVV